MADDTITFVADWSQSHFDTCDQCQEDTQVLTFVCGDEGEYTVDLCRPCALALASREERA